MQSLKLIMAGLLLVCLLPMPYGYYTFVRFVAMVAFAFLAFAYYEKESKATPLVFTFGALALLFQPFVKVVLERGVWNIVDVAAAALLLYLCFREREGSIQQY